jgi:hypothetical protein
LEECEREHLESREQFYLDTLRPAYNSITDIKRRFGAEQREKIAASFRARAVLITHCPKGHAYDEANTYKNKKGKRTCRACNALRVYKFYANDETLAKREYRRARAKADYEKNRVLRREQIRQYAIAHKEEKRKYDRLHRTRRNDLRRSRRMRETLEQHEHRLAGKRDSYHRLKGRP